MKVLALNSSPRSEGQSKTQMMLDALVGGMRDAGAEVEVVQLRHKKIHYCIGCYTCWTKTPGRCLHNDDMTRELFPKWLNADLVIYATPLYHYTVNAQMKAFIERTLPSILPFFELQGDLTTHPARQSQPKSVLLSVAGFPEMAVFDLLSHYARFVLGRHMGLIAEIYRPGAEMLGGMKEEILAATGEAGRQLVALGVVKAETLQCIQQPVVDVQALAMVGNVFWKTCIAEGVTPKEFRDKNLVPRPDSLPSFMHFFKYGLNTQAAQGRTVVLQFEFSGTVIGACRFVVADGRVQAYEGIDPTADITIETPFELWMDIMTRKADGQKMFMAQKYKVHGDLELMLTLLHKEA